MTKKRKKVWVGYVDKGQLVSKLFSWKEGDSERTDELIIGDIIISRVKLFDNDPKWRITVEEL